MPLLNIKIIFKWVCYIHSYEYGKCVASTFEQVTIAMIKNDQLAYFNIKKNKHIEQFEIISRSFCFVISNHKGRLRFTDKLYH